MNVSKNIIEIKAQLPPQVKLVAVSKFRPLEQLREAYDAGQRVFAESRPSEFEAKVKALPQDIEWHFIGHLQTNKLRHVLPYTNLIHSVDTLHLMDAIERFGSSNGLEANVLLEVHVGAEDTKQGFTPEEILELFKKGFAKWPHIKVCGLMGMASHTTDEKRIENDFSVMESLFKKLREQYPAMTEFRELSIGMSSDWKIALRHSATMVRIGSAIFCNE